MRDRRNGLESLRARAVSAARIFALVAALPSCATPDDAHEALPLGAVEQVCVHENRPPTVARRGGFTLDFSRGSYWIFGETVIEDDAGKLVFLDSSQRFSARAAPLCAAGPGPGAAAAPVIPLTPEEQAFNRRHPEGPSIKIWPVSGFVADDVGIVYYRKVLFRGYFDFTVIGTGAARLEPGQRATRLVAERHAEEPTLLWLDPQDDWGDGAFLAPDGFAYVYGCVKYGVFERGCRVARVPPARAGDPDAYEYRRLDDWSAHPQDAEFVLWGPPAPSVRWNAWLGGYLVVYAEVLSNEIVTRTAPTPWGPFDDPRPLLTGEPPARFAISEVEQHAADAGDGGRTLLLSYFTDPERGTAGMRMVRVRLDESGRPDARRR